DVHNTKKKDTETITMTRATITNMKKALDFVKQNGPIQKTDPNAVKKRKSLPTKSNNKITSNSSKTKKPEIEVEFDFKSEEFQKILNAKSSHDEHTNRMVEYEY